MARACKPRQHQHNPSAAEVDTRRKVAAVTGWGLICGSSGGPHNGWSDIIGNTWISNIAVASCARVSRSGAPPNKPHCLAHTEYSCFDANASISSDSDPCVIRRTRHFQNIQLACPLGKPWQRCAVTHPRSSSPRHPGSARLSGIAPYRWKQHVLCFPPAFE